MTLISTHKNNSKLIINAKVVEMVDLPTLIITELLGGTDEEKV